MDNPQLVAIQQLILALQQTVNTIHEEHTRVLSR
jgi:hypothetical protein